MIQIAGYEIDVLNLLGLLALVAGVLAALPWVMWTLLRRPLFSAHAAYNMQRWAARLRAQGDEAWGKRPPLLSRLTSLIIGAAGGGIGLFIIALNLVILSRIFDFLGFGGLNTFEPELPLIGKLGQEIGTVSLIAAAIFVAVECGLGVVLFFLWHTPLKLLPSENQTEAPMTRAARALAVVVGFVLLAAAGFECYMNYLQVTTLEDTTAAYVGVAAAFIGVIVPLATEILSGFAWHAAVAPLSEYALTALAALHYRCAAMWVSWLSYPHADLRLCGRVGAELNTLSRQLRGSFRHLREVCRRASELPAVKNDAALSKTLASTRARLRNV